MAKAQDVSVRQVGPKGAKKAIRHAIKMRRPTFLWGPPGIGKSDLVKQIGDDEDDDHEEIDLPLRSEHLYKVDPTSGTMVLKMTQRGHNFVVTIKEEKLGNGWGFFDRDAF